MGSPEANLTPEQPADNLGQAAGGIIFLTAIFLLYFIGRTVMAPLMPTIEADLGLDHVQAGSLFLFLSIGNLGGLLGTSFVSALINHRRTIALSAIGTGVTFVLVGLSGSLWGLRLGLLVMGLAGGLYIPSGIAVVLSLVTPRLWGRAVAIHEMAPNLALVTSPLAALALMRVASWRGVVIFLGCVSLILGLAFVRFGLGGRLKSHPPNLDLISQTIRQPAVWILVILFSLGTAGTIGVYSMQPLYLVKGLGMDQTTVNLLVFLSRLPGIAMAFVGGWACDRFGVRRTLFLSTAAIGVSTVLLGLAHHGFLIVMLFVQSGIVATFYPPGFAAISRYCRPETRVVATSLVVALSLVVACGFIPVGIGYAADKGGFGMGFTATGVLILIGLIIFPWLHSAAQTSSGADEKD